ncbi:hypothetical protein T11_17797 [Trichinella zimbabwensis]|uniref:Uncharacterized protein n=1 Tax=Trichinella zimbabwensis TaxID=268475 RepID=A0A0V1GV31_9BILA|nr:hypothetical protein T11_17797 [Trichinella zimbabwensis]
MSVAVHSDQSCELRIDVNSAKCRNKQYLSKMHLSALCNAITGTPEDKGNRKIWYSADASARSCCTIHLAIELNFPQ